MYMPTYAQNKSTSKNQYIKILQDRLKQIVNKGIHYNYYLGEDLYTERSYISDAKVSINDKDQVEIYLYSTTQKYDVNSNETIRSEHGDSFVFDPAFINEIKLKGKLSDYSKSELGLLVIDFTQEIEKRTMVQRNKHLDPDLLQSPPVYEFELPYLKADMTNPEAIQNALIDLKNSIKLLK